MQKMLLGKTGLSLSRTGFGALPIQRVSFDEAAALLNRAVDKLKLEIARQGGVNAAGLELPEAHIRGDVNTPYRCIGATIYTMQQAGFARVGFISHPPALNAAG